MTLIGEAFSPGDDRGITALFAVLVMAAACRPFGYVWWTAGITVALTFRYEYFGQTGPEAFGHRLIGIAGGRPGPSRWGGTWRRGYLPWRLPIEVVGT